MKPTEVNSPEMLKRYLMENTPGEPGEDMIRILYGLIEHHYADPFVIKSAYGAGICVGLKVPKDG